MGEGTGKILYGIKQIRVKPVLASGAPDGAAIAYESAEPQECSIEPLYSEGESAELRGGDSLVALIEESDILLGFDLGLKNAKLTPEICEAIVGGTIRYNTDSPPAVIGWTAPNTAAEAAPFEMAIWVSNYTEGKPSVKDGYIKFFMPFCKGMLGSKAPSDRTFTLEEFSIKARQNPYDDANCLHWEKVVDLT